MKYNIAYMLRDSIGEESMVIEADSHIEATNEALRLIEPEVWANEALLESGNIEDYVSGMRSNISWIR